VSPWGSPSVPEGIDVSTPVFVLRRTRNPFHHGGLAITRSAGAWGVPVHAVQESRWSPAAWSRYEKGRLSLPADASDDRWLRALLEAGRRIGRAVLVPIDDVAAVFVEDHALALAECFTFPARPAGLTRRLSDKRALHHLAGELDIPVPDAVFPAEEGDVAAYAATGEFPVVVKQIDAWHSARGNDAPSVTIARDGRELLLAYRRMESDAAPNVMLQQYIPGTSESVWMFNGYFDADSVCRFGAAGVKLRQRGPHTGPTTLGLCAPNPTVEDQTLRLMRAVGYRGILDLGFRYDARDGGYKLLDVNPRVGGSFRLFTGDAGMDVLRALYLDLTGQPVPRAIPRHGRRWIVEPYDLVAAVQLGREGELGLRRWRRSLRGVQEAAWFDPRDPLPFLGMVLRMSLSLPGRRR